jgi:outer membrane protein assembly factor BamD
LPVAAASPIRGLTIGWSAGKLYSEAKEAQADGTWDKAAKYLEKLKPATPTAVYAQQAQLELGYVYWKAGEAGLGLAACDRFIKLHPSHPAVDYVYYLKGLINFNEDLGYAGYISTQDPTERDPKAARESFDAFRELVTRFPDSKYTPDARQRMNYLVNALASLEVHVARYYLKRGAYVAAANRAQFAIKTYPNGTGHRGSAVHPGHRLRQAGHDRPARRCRARDEEELPEQPPLRKAWSRKKAWWQLW